MLLTIKKHKDLEVLTYDEILDHLIEHLIDDGIIETNISIIRKDKERLICIFTDGNKEYVLKMGNHEKRHAGDDSTKYELLKKEDQIYMALNALSDSDRARFPEIYAGGDVDDKFYYILMERVNGITLYDYLRVGPHRRDAVLSILINLTAAIQALYSLGLVHGDLSVENVMIGLDGAVKLINFEKTHKIKIYRNVDINIRGVPTGCRNSYLKNQGVGYFYLIVQTLDSTGYYDSGLIATIKKAIEDCHYPSCNNVYEACGRILTKATSTSRDSRQLSRRSSRQRSSRSRSSRQRSSRGSRNVTRRSIRP